jgi:SAM-dependent methyltransferase
MTSHLHERLLPLVEAAANLTRGPRSRYAEGVFLGRSVGLKDRVLTRAHFSLFPGKWEVFGTDQHHLRPFVTAVQRLTPPEANAFVVDVGTGAGVTAAILARQWPQARIEGIDIAGRMVRRAGRMNNEPNLRFRRASVAQLPYAASSVHVVTCHNAIVDPPELRRVMATGACLVMTSTWYPLRDDATPWVQRFEACGFRRTATGVVDQGSWELWQAD